MGAIQGNATDVRKVKMERCKEKCVLCLCKYCGCCCECCKDEEGIHEREVDLRRNKLKTL